VFLLLPSSLLGPTPFFRQFFYSLLSASVLFPVPLLLLLLLCLRLGSVSSFFFFTIPLGQVIYLLVLWFEGLRAASLVVNCTVQYSTAQRELFHVS